jgi:L,D-transpeptidase catalytic domain
VGSSRLRDAILRRRGGRIAAALVVSVIAGAATGLRAEAAAPSAPAAVGAVGMAATPSGSGYWITASYGDVLNFGGAGALGGPGNLALNAPLVGVARTPSGNGYWLLGGDGGVFTYGDAPFRGSEGGAHLNQPVVGIAGTHTGNGYWLVASDGGIFSFGDAQFLGSMGDRRLNQPIVGMAATPDGGGYWLVASDGGIFSFGDAQFFGSMGDRRLNQPIVGMASSPTGGGYWMVARDGGVFSFGDAQFHGSMGATPLNQPVVGMAASPSGGGYWMVARDGGIFSFGDAAFNGSGAGRIRFGNDVASRPDCGVPSNAVGASGKTIVISLACQLLSAYQDGVPILTTFITTGRPALPTPPGQYSVLRKVSPWLMTSDWPTSSPYWYPPSWVQYTLWFRNDGYAIHDAPWRATYGPGTEANGSHGCVNVPMPTMATLYGWAVVGTPVRVY